MAGRTFRASAMLFLVALGCGAGAHANDGPLPRESVPEPLRPWVPWVLHGAQDRQCPFFYNNSEQGQCSWLSRLSLSAAPKSATFTLQLEAFRPLWIPLPGDAKHWPLEVKVDGTPAAVVAQADRPGIQVLSGAHSVSGTFAWNEMPESLALPSSIGLIALSVSGSRVPAPNIDGAGRLWLKQTSERAVGAERLDIHVNRLVVDDIPLLLVTHIDVTASGKNQEIVLPAVLLAGFTALSLSSPLPARFESDGGLRVQVRPGRWELTAVGRSMQQQASLTLPRSKDKLAAAEEVWAFEARPELALTQIEGVPAVDPQQTTLPPDWKRFPAYLLKPGDSMRLKQTKRGDPDTQPDRLGLARRIWLDFDGGGYTVQDRINGTIARSWRLEMPKPETLGRVAVDGTDQYITQLEGSSTPGVELRRGNANIEAESRIDERTRSLSATGWSQDFDRLSASLYLPPGWRLLHASGVDHARQAWVERWTLLDFFLVLILTLAAGKLFGWRWGVVALLALTWTYHESGAPTWYLLNLLAAVALLTVLREGRLRKSIAVYRWLSLAALVLAFIPFAIHQVRHALYPVLERPWTVVGAAQQPAAVADEDNLAEERQAAAPAAPAPAATGKVAEQKAVAPEPQAGDQLRRRQVELAKARPERKDQPARPSSSYGFSKSESGVSASPVLSQIDPNAKVQTGPGLPQWTWNAYDLQWSGPVEHTQTIRLWLLSPLVIRVMTFASLTLLVILFARVTVTGPLRMPWPRKATIAIALAVMMGGFVAVEPEPAHAQALPSAELLEQLRDKLLAPPRCVPHCAEISRVKVVAASGEIQLRLEAHALADTAIPLPGGAQQWLPDQVTVDGAPALGLLRDSGGNLWLQLAKGVHQIAMQADASGRHSAQIALPLKPHRLEASVSGWALDGLGEDGEPGESLLLTRAAGKGAAPVAGAADSLPPFVRVERTLSLGLVWQVSTRIVRANASSEPVLLSIPLIDGESVTSSDVKVRDGAATVNIGPQTGTFQFDSALKQSARLELKAPADASQIQVWRLNASPQWHVQLAGIPVIHQQDRAGQWLPEWRPWPGERVTLTLTKPAGVAGQTLTLDRSSLTVSPGIRATDAQLQVSLRSSRGGRHLITLPDGAVLQSVAINGRTQPIRLEGRKLDLPIAPGAESVIVTWREAHGITGAFSTPRVDVGTAGVNGSIELKLPESRWALLVGGPAIGPAVLFWGVLIVLAVLAFALGRSRLAPLKSYHWFLLLIGLTQAPWLAATIVVVWFLALGFRRRLVEGSSGKFWFNLGQVLLVALTLAAIVSLYLAVKNGLLGYPEMQIAGNGSNAWNLHWYQDRTQAGLPTAWVISVPMMIYRLLMLAWALWLAYSLLKWLRWAWESYSEGGYWRKIEFGRRAARAARSAAAEGQAAS